MHGGISSKVDSAPGLSALYFELMYSLFAGELFKELGKLANLEVFNASYNGLRGGLSTRSERFNVDD